MYYWADLPKKKKGASIEPRRGLHCEMLPLSLALSVFLFTSIVYFVSPARHWAGLCQFVINRRVLCTHRVQTIAAHVILTNHKTLTLKPSRSKHRITENVRVSSFPVSHRMWVIRYAELFHLVLNLTHTFKESDHCKLSYEFCRRHYSLL